MNEDSMSIVELDALTCQTSTSTNRMVEALTKAVEQIIQFLVQLTEQELDEVAAGIEAANQRKGEVK